MKTYKLLLATQMCLIPLAIQAIPPSNPNPRSADYFDDPTPEEVREVIRVDQSDPTDSLAIPLDNSEMDIEAELENLERNEKQYQKRGR